MPTYQYKCTQCAEPLEVVQKFSDAALTECPSCQGALRKVFSPVGVVFKGSGFYKTDSRSSTPAAKPAGDKTAGDAAAGDAKGAGGTKTEASGGTDGSTGTSSGSAAPAAGPTKATPPSDKVA